MKFAVDYLEKTGILFQEALKFKKYKSMHPVFAVLVGIFMIPFVLLSVLAAVVLCVTSFLFKVISMPTSELHKLLHNEGQSVKHATQFVIYLISWNFIFLTYALLSFFLIVLTVDYAVCSILTYIWSLGGFKFHAFADKYEDISIQVDGSYKPAIPVIYICVIVFFALLLPLIQCIISAIDYGVFSFSFIKYSFRVYNAEWSGLRMLFSFIYSLAVFAPNPKPAA